MIKITITRFCYNLGSGCVRILNYVYAWLEPCARILNDVYASFNTELKNQIFIDFIIQRY